MYEPLLSLKYNGSRVLYILFPICKILGARAPPPPLSTPLLGLNIHKVPLIIPEFPVNKVPWDKVPQVAAWPRHLRGKGTGAMTPHPLKHFTYFVLVRSPPWAPWCPPPSNPSATQVPLDATADTNPGTQWRS